MLSALVGCISRIIFKDVIWLSAAVGMSLALLCMIITKTTHPPGDTSRLLSGTLNPSLRTHASSLICQTRGFGHEMIGDMSLAAYKALRTPLDCTGCTWNKFA